MWLIAQNQKEARMREMAADEQQEILLNSGRPTMTAASLDNKIILGKCIDIVCTGTGRNACE